MSGGLVHLILPRSECSLCVDKEVIKLQLYHFHVNTGEKLRGGRGGEGRGWEVKAAKLLH